MKRLNPIALALTIALLLPAVTRAQQQPAQARPRGAGGPEAGFEKFLYPPELMMQHQAAIGLKPEQRAAITRAVRDFQGQVLELQWQMQDETQRLGQLLDRPRVDETATLGQVEKVLALERQVKLAHMALLVQIKNLLTPEQQARLVEMRERSE